MKLPADNEIYHAEVADYWLDHDGILYGISKPTVRTIENLKRSFELIGKITGGKKVFIIMDVTNTGIQGKTERDFSYEQLAKYFKAMAIISESSFGQMVTNTFLALTKQPIPMRLVKDEHEARKWLRKLL